MASPAPAKALRIAVMQEGSFAVVDERLFRRPGPVSAGPDARATFIVPASELPPRFTLFEYKAPRYQLVFTEAMRGRISLGEGGGHLELDELRRAGQARPRGDVYVLELPESARGVVRLGPVSLIFNFVTPLPESAPEALPAAVKGGVWRTVDRLFFAVLVASLALHFSGATLLAFSERPPERELSLDELPDRFARAFLPPPKPLVQEKPAEVAATPEAPPEQKEEAPRPEAADAQRAEPRPSPQEAERRRAAIAKKVSGAGLLKVLGSSGAAGQGAFSDLLGSSTGSQDVSSALAGASGVGVAVQGSVGAAGPRGASSGAVAAIGEVATRAGGPVDLGPKREVQVTGLVRDAAPEVEGDDVDRDVLARYVKARLKAIQSCYEKELKRNPGLKGKVVVRFSVQPTGRTGDIEVEENSLGSEAVAACIRTVIRGWAFPLKPAEDVPVVYPFLFAPAG